MVKNLLTSAGDVGVQASEVVAPGLNSYGAQAWLLRGMWGLPRPGSEPTSPALVSRFFTTEPPGKPLVATAREKPVQQGRPAQPSNKQAKRPDMGFKSCFP